MYFEWVTSFWKTTLSSLFLEALSWEQWIGIVLTKKENAGILDAQSVCGHTGVVPIILFTDVAEHEDSGGANHLDVDGLSVGHPTRRKNNNIETKLVPGKRK